MKENLWLSFSSHEGVRLSPFKDRATVGSASSNAVVLGGKGVRALHGQFLLKESSGDLDDVFYRDFSERALVSLRSVSAVHVGLWKVEVDDFESIRKRYEQSMHASFKVHLKNHPLDSLESVLHAFHRDWFLETEIPLDIRKSLEAQFSELSLRGPIERLLEDPDVTDVLVEDFDSIWIERKGELCKTSASFTHREAYSIYLENLLSDLHKTVDEVHPYIDFFLNDGSRGHLIGPPLTDGARYLSIRKPRKEAWTFEVLKNLGMFSASALDFLNTLVRQEKNVLVSGATGSGKTTLLKAMLAACDSHARLVVIEDVPELRLPRPNAAFLTTRTDVRGQLPPVTMRDLVKQSLRMRPDRIVIGEVRGAEALDLLHAMNTGHRGCMGSLHANSARDALYRLQGLIHLSHETLSEGATRDLIARNIHVVLHCGRGENGRRFLQEAACIRGSDGDQILLEPVAL